MKPAAPTTPRDTIIAIDWSGRVDAAGQRRHIVAAIWHAGKVRIESGRTRDEVADWLLTLATTHPNMVVGFDFCFGFPAWFTREVGARSGPDFWHVAALRGEQWLTQSHLDQRFWGRPHKRPAEFSGPHLHRMLRGTDIDCKLAAHIPEPERALRVRGITAKSVFQIGGAGAVGTASLRGMPMLTHLRAAGFRVWPFDAVQPGAPLVLEIYTRLNTGPVHKSNAAARAAYLLQKRTTDPAYAALSRTVLARAKAGEDAFDALVSCMVMAAHQDSIDRLTAPRDPNYKLEGFTWAPDTHST